MASMAVTLGYQLISGIGVGSNPAPNSVLFILLLLFIAIYYTFHKLEISINVHMVQLRYGVIRRIIYIPNIKSTELVHLNFIQFGGLGLKHNLKGEVAYSTRTGEAVKLHLRNGKPVLFTPNNTTEAISAINRIIS